MDIGVRVAAGGGKFLEEVLDSERGGIAQHRGAQVEGGRIGGGVEENEGLDGPAERDAEVVDPTACLVEAEVRAGRGAPVEHGLEFEQCRARV